MVNCSSASSGVGQDAGLVGLEVNSVGLNGDGDGLLSNSGLESGNAVGSDLGVVGNKHGGSLGGVVNASTIGGSVGVVRLEVGVVALEVSESTCLPTAIATEAGLNAINELLLGEGEKLAGGNLVSTFEGTS